MTTLESPPTARQSSLPWHLRNNWAPVLDERTDTELRVDGTIPDVLQGIYVPTGPNPSSGTSDHWFFGDGEGNAEEPVYGSALWKYDLTTGACSEHQLGDGVRGAEPVFAPASPEAGEDEGWIISLTHDTNSDESRLIIVDAQNFSAPPVTTIHLPRRVPYGAHGSWVPDSKMN